MVVSVKDMPGVFDDFHHMLRWVAVLTDNQQRPGLDLLMNHLERGDHLGPTTTATSRPGILEMEAEKPDRCWSPSEQQQKHSNVINKEKKEQVINAWRVQP